MRISDWSSDVCSSDLQIAFVAAVHPQGLCEDLEALETGLATAGDKESEPKGHKTSEPPPAHDSAVLTEWKSLETVRDWAHLSPKLSGLDLRPYLFVTKDKKAYFGPGSVVCLLAERTSVGWGKRVSVSVKP